MDTVQPPAEETWNLTELFEDDDAFRDEKRRLQTEISRLDRFRGGLDRSAAELATALDTVAEATKAFVRLRCYAVLKSDADTRVAAHQAMRQEVDLLATELASRTSWVRPEILALPENRVESFLAAEPRLAPHAFFLRDLLRRREHVRAPAEEHILAEASLLTRGPSSLFQVLNDVELPRPEVTLEDGRTVRLTPVAFHEHRASANREDRLRVFPAYFDAYAAFRESFGQNLYGAVKAHLFRARVRRYPSCLAASLDGDNVPVRVYRNLIEQVRTHLPVLHRYFELRRRALGLERLEYCDLYGPLGRDAPRRYAPAEARELVARSLAPLGQEYGEALRAAFSGRWIDWHPTAGKRSGAYATGWAYDVHPYVLLNYVGDYDSVSTLAHEMGHAMHSHFSNRTQPFPVADYSIFVAEVASTLNEALLNRTLVEATEEPGARRALVASWLDGVRGTLFRQTMFAEFELAIHERVEQGEVLTGESLSALYLELLRDYHGHDRGVVWIDERYAVEWAAIPHFHYDFYVYQYATGIVAAQALAAALTDGAPGARERYLEFLRSGGSDHPLQLLRRAGVDLEAADPYRAAFGRIAHQLDVLEDLLD